MKHKRIEDLPEEEQELIRVRDDSNQIVEALEQEHEQDLARHLYTVHHLRTLRKQHGLFDFPLNQYSAWPMHDYAPSFNMDTRTIRGCVPGLRLFPPPIDSTYTKSEEPSELPSANESTPAITQDQAMKESSQTLLSEIDSEFKRQVYRKVHREVQNGERLVPVVTPEPQLPLQSRHKVMELINTVLDNSLLNLDQQGRRKVRDWTDIIRNHTHVGKAKKRCKDLFAEGDEHLEAKERFMHTFGKKNKTSMDEMLVNNMIGRLCYDEEYGYYEKQLKRANERVNPWGGGVGKNNKKRKRSH